MNEYKIVLEITTLSGVMIETERYRLAEVASDAKESALTSVKQMWNDRPVVVKSCRKVKAK